MLCIRYTACIHSRSPPWLRHCYNDTYKLGCGVCTDIGDPAGRQEGPIVLRLVVGLVVGLVLVGLVLVLVGLDGGGIVVDQGG